MELKAVVSNSCSVTIVVEGLIVLWGGRLESGGDGSNINRRRAERESIRTGVLTFFCRIYESFFELEVVIFERFVDGRLSIDNKYGKEGREGAKFRGSWLRCKWVWHH